jgi:hypothetical protein
MAGTPWIAVHCSEVMAWRVSGAEKVSEGYTTLAPAVRQASRPRTRPKQWNKGGGQQRMSLGVSESRVPMKRALLSMELETKLACLRVSERDSDTY